MTLQSTLFLHLAAACLLSLSTQAMADGALEIELQSLKVVTTADGGTAFTPATSVKPGDVIEYRAVYRNTSDAPLRGVITTLPIPAAGVHYIDGTALPDGAQASTNGQTFASAPLQRTLTAADGSIRQMPVPTAEYRALRWHWPQLAAGASQTVRAQVRVLSAAPAAPSTNQGETQ